MQPTSEIAVIGALPRTPGFSSGMDSHRSGWAAESKGVIWREFAVFGNARPLGKTFRRCSIVTNCLRKTGQRVRWQGRRITLASNVTPTLRREYP